MKQENNIINKTNQGGRATAHTQTVVLHYQKPLTNDKIL